MCTCFDNAEQSCKENLYTIFSQLPAKIMDRLANIYFQGVAKFTTAPSSLFRFANLSDLS